MCKAMSTAVIQKTVLHSSTAAFVSGPLLIRETVYGIVKRLDFFVRHIEAYRQRKNLEPGKVRVLDFGSRNAKKMNWSQIATGFQRTLC